ncbi:GNAT family N-acetyltransferase [Acetobacterium wieringae]|uniref:GNAT family N-acetyltransferase n=1 Tax=Acetobacterium wieringae TaxID=52694 RepID=UPI002B20E04F|nr:GNAT family N-acetyltransferase [Acetobacterium wieringae]MEA4807188.1 GNAT family N-acetyltransferase [Acetobacterium wieringae]
MIKKKSTLTQDAKTIREEVFMKEQGFKDEFDAIDAQAIHLIYYEDNVPVAVCRYYADTSPGVTILGRLAVRASHRGKNLGKHMVEAAEKSIRQEGATKIVLSAQVKARSFYEKCGFAAIGDLYLDEGCPHIRMEKTLTSERG